MFLPIFSWIFLFLGASACRSGWMQFKESCYLLADDHVTWHQAGTQCLLRHGNLVTIETREENDFLKSHLRPGNSYYIGATDISSEGYFHWIDTGEPLNSMFTDWAPAQPDNYQNGEDCVVFWAGHGFLWDDTNCDYQCGFVCEMKDGA